MRANSLHAAMRLSLFALLLACGASLPPVRAQVPLALRYTLTSPLPPGSDDSFGGLSPVSDQDGDGAADFVVNARDGQTLAINIFSGLTGERLRVLTDSDGNLDYPFVEIGDATGDGVPDFVIGAPQETLTPGSSLIVGAAYLYSGASLTRRWRRLSPDPGEFNNFGSAAAPLGDATGDGRADVLIAEPGISELHAFSGATGAHLYTVDALNGGAGRTLVAVGDLDGDGVNEVAASSSDGTGTNQGQVAVISGASGAILRVLDAPVPEDGNVYGRAMAALGDLDGDGHTDLVVAAQSEDVGGETNVGRLYAVSAATGAVLRTFDLPAAHVAADSTRRLGIAVAAGADLDGDGVGDVAATALRSAPARRRVYLFSGATGDVLGWAENVQTTRYTEYGGQLALLGGAGGRLVVAASDETVNGVERAGRVYVYGFLPVAAEPEPAAASVSVSVSPNPSAGAAAVTLTMSSASSVRVAVVDALGRVVAVLHDGAVSAGARRFALPSGLAAGVYAVVAEGAGAVVARARWVVAR